MPEPSLRRFRSVLDLGEQCRLHVFKPFLTTKDVGKGPAFATPTYPYFSLPGTPRNAFFPKRSWKNWHPMRSPFSHADLSIAIRNILPASLENQQVTE